VDLILISATEIVKCYGTHCTKTGLNSHFQRDIRPNVKLIQEALAQGDDPKDITLVEGIHDSKIGNGQRPVVPHHTYYMFSLCFYLYRWLTWTLIHDLHRDRQVLWEPPHEEWSHEPFQS
jgi:hypothetical protein